jgi:hypothetical protein
MRLNKRCLSLNSLCYLEDGIPQFCGAVGTQLSQFRIIVAKERLLSGLGCQKYVSFRLLTLP